MEFFYLSDEEISVLWLSTKIGFWSLVISFIPGIFFGWVLARKNFYGKSILDAIIHLPLVLPPVVVGYLLLLNFGNNGVIGKFLNETFGFSIAFSWKGAVLSSAIMGFPLLVRSVRVSIELLGTRLEQVARTLGANSFKTFFTITLPLSFHGILTGLILCFARSLGEFGATITFVSNIPEETRTIPLAIFTYTQIPDGEEQVFRLIVLSIGLSFFTLIASEILTTKAKKILEK